MYQPVNEPPLPPPTPPVHVCEDLSIQPIEDRGVIVQCIHSLAVKIFDELERDKLEHERYARRLRLSNRISKGVRSREEFVVPLPYDVYCWNDVDIETLELRLLRIVLDRPEDYLWYQVLALFDQFFDKDAKNCLEQLDSDQPNDQERASEPQVQSSDTTVQGDSNMAPVEQAPVKVVEIPVINCDDDSDDDIQIIGSVEPK